MTLKFKLGLHLKSASSPVPSSSKAIDNDRQCLGRSNSIPGSPFSRWLQLRKRNRRSSVRDPHIGQSPITPSVLSQVTTGHRASDTLPYVSRSVIIHPEDFTDPFSAPRAEPPRRNNFLDHRASLLEDMTPQHISSTTEQDLVSTKRRLESLDAIFAREPPSPTEFMRLNRGLSMNLYGNRRGPGNALAGTEGDLGNKDSNSVMSSDPAPVKDTQPPDSSTNAVSPLTPPQHNVRKVQKKRSGTDMEPRRMSKYVTRGPSSKSNKRDLLRIAQACQTMARRARKENPKTWTEAHFHKAMYRIAFSLYIICCVFCAALYWRGFVAEYVMRPFDRFVPLVCIVLGVGLAAIDLLIRGLVRICFGLFTSFCEADLRRAFHRGECVDAEGKRLDEAGMIVGGLLW